MGSREGETWGSWWRETAVYQWCAWAYDYAAAAWFWAALPFQLLAQVCITHALRALGPQAGAKWLVRGARLGVGSWLGWRGVSCALPVCTSSTSHGLEDAMVLDPAHALLRGLRERLARARHVQYPAHDVGGEELGRGFCGQPGGRGLRAGGVVGARPRAVLQLYLAGYACGRSGLQEAMRTAHHLAIPKTVDYDYTAACLALADAGVVEALRHIHDTATIWVRQQHARLTLNAIESALNSALGRRLRRDQQAAASRAPSAARGRRLLAREVVGGGNGPRRRREASGRRRPRAPGGGGCAGRRLAPGRGGKQCEKEEAKAPAPKKKKGKKGPPGRARGKAAAAPAPAARLPRPRHRRRHALNRRRRPHRRHRRRCAPSRLRAGSDAAHRAAAEGEGRGSSRGREAARPDTGARAHRRACAPKRGAGRDRGRGGDARLRAGARPFRGPRALAPHGAARARKP